MLHAVCVSIPPTLIPTWKFDAWIGSFIVIDIARCVTVIGRSSSIRLFTLPFQLRIMQRAGGSNPRYFHAVWLHSRDRTWQERVLSRNVSRLSHTRTRHRTLEIFWMLEINKINKICSCLCRVFRCATAHWKKKKKKKNGEKKKKKKKKNKLSAIIKNILKIVKKLSKLHCVCSHFNQSDIVIAIKTLLK